MHSCATRFILALKLDALPGPPPIPFAEALLTVMPIALWLVGRLHEPSGWRTVWGDVTRCCCRKPVIADRRPPLADDIGRSLASSPGILIAPWLASWLGKQAVTVDRPGEGLHGSPNRRPCLMSV